MTRAPGRAALRDERGEMSLTGLLVAMVLFALVSWGTVTTFAQSQTLATNDRVRGDAQEDARRTSDRMARELRNLAGPSPNQPQAVDRIQPQDLIFQVVRPTGPAPAGNPTNVMRVRYCLDGRVLRRMEQPPTAYASGVPAPTTCDGTGWTNVTALSSDVSNGGRAVFTYNNASTAQVTAVHTDLWVDPDPGKGTGETQVSTGVFLRNQNRWPVVSAAVARGPVGTLVLNGTASYDPEGDTLTYQWYRDGVEIPDAKAPVYRLTGLPLGIPVSITLKISDSARLTATSSPVVITP